MYSGVVGRVSEKPWNGKTFYSFTLNGQDGWYNTGMKKPPTTGTSVSFTANPNAKGYLEVDYHSIKKLEDGAAGPAQGVATVSRSSGNGIGKDDYWSRKEERDLKNDAARELGATRNTAIEVIKLMIDKEVIKLPAQAKREGFFWELLETYTDKLMGKGTDDLVTEEEQEDVKDTVSTDDWK